jgi:hypothetical protein
MEISRTPKDSHLDTIRYEINMLTFCFVRLSKSSEWKEQADMFVYLESFLLHYRNLIQFFFGNGSQKEGSLNIVNAKVWAGRDLTTAELSAIQTPAKNLIKKYWENISIYLQHCTERRADEDITWKVKDMFEEIKPIIVQFQKTILQE